ncbi:hypothetical protein M0804_013116 [Polistes exclamans]|nr:hypothetical protein M0804_013116 [Polistes exclamans]
MAGLNRHYPSPLSKEPRETDPYNLVMGKLRARTPPVSKALEPETVLEVVQGLFTDGPTEPTPDADRGQGENGDIVTTEEIAQAASRILSGKAPTPDGVPGIVVSEETHYCTKKLAGCFTTCQRYVCFPPACKLDKLVPIRQRRDSPVDSPVSYQPIVLLDYIGKLFEKVIVARHAAGPAGAGDNERDGTMDIDVDLATPTTIVSRTRCGDLSVEVSRLAKPTMGLVSHVHNGYDGLVRRTCWHNVCVRWGRGLWPLRSNGESRGMCSLMHRGSIFVGVQRGNSLVISVYFPSSEAVNMFSRLFNELKELLGRFPTLPALVASDFNAWYTR